jgi:hypothetical protein
MGKRAVSAAHVNDRISNAVLCFNRVPASLSCRQDAAKVEDSNPCFSGIVRFNCDGLRRLSRYGAQVTPLQLLPNAFVLFFPTFSNSSRLTVVQKKQRIFQGVGAAAAQRREIHMAQTAGAGQGARTRRGLSRSGTEYGPLTDLPDWEYLDGTPAEPTQAQLRRETLRQAQVERIKELTQDIDGRKGASQN